MTYQSETDSPIEEINWQVRDGLTLDRVAVTMGGTNRRTVVLPADDFFVSQSDPDIQNAVKSLKAKTSGLTLFKTPKGDCKYALLLIGFASNTQIVGLRAFSVET